MWRRVVDGFKPCPRWSGDRRRSFADGAARAAGIARDVEAGAGAGGGAVEQDQRGGRPDRADVGAVSGGEVVAEDGGGHEEGGGSENDGSWTRPTEAVWLVVADWWMEGGGVWGAVADCAQHAGDGRIAQGVTAGGADIAAVVPGAGD